MRILSAGLPLPILRRAFRKDLREQGAPAPKAKSKSAAKTKPVNKVKGERARPKASDEPPRSWRVPYTVGDSSGLPWFVTPV